MDQDNNGSNDDNNSSSGEKRVQHIMPNDVSLDMYDGSDETTRRVGTAQPSFAPITSFAPQLSRNAAVISTSHTKTSGFTDVSAKNKNQDETVFIWRVSKLMPVPPCYTLERSACFVEHTRPDVVSARISSVLRNLSIAAVYDDVDAKVSCLSSSGVDFRVKLYQGKGSFSHGVIVEVQRRFGFSLEYHQQVKAVLNASQDKPYTVPEKSDVNILPAPALFANNNNNSNNDEASDFAGSLNTVKDLMSRPKHDSHFLALQILLNLVDCNKTTPQTSEAVARELLSPNNEVGSRMLSFLDRNNVKSDDAYDLRGKSFSVLACALESVRGQVDNQVRNLLERILVDELYQAQSSPHTAELAAKGIESLLRSNKNIEGINGALETAYQVGKERHIGLMQLAQTCLGMSS